MWMKISSICPTLKQSLCHAAHNMNQFAAHPHHHLLKGPVDDIINVCLGVILPVEVVLGWICGWGVDENQLNLPNIEAISGIRLTKTSINSLLIDTIIS
jgi:hypothetical protein